MEYKEKLEEVLEELYSYPDKVLALINSSYFNDTETLLNTDFEDLSEVVADLIIEDVYGIYLYDGCEFSILDENEQLNELSSLREYDEDELINSLKRLNTNIINYLKIEEYLDDCTGTSLDSYYDNIGKNYEFSNDYLIHNINE